MDLLNNDFPFSRTALNGKHAMIFGASKGIGAATAKMMAMAGADVTLCARNLDSLQKVANEIDEHTTGRIVIKTIDLEDLSLIDKLIDEVKLNNDIPANKIIIGGFSQGCMISLQTGIKRKDKINSIIGYSGKIIDTDHLSKNLISRPNIMLMHGDKDQVVTIDGLLEAKNFFNKNNYSIETKIFENCEHRIPSEGASLGLQFIKKHLY